MHVIIALSFALATNPNQYLYKAGTAYILLYASHAGIL